MGETNNDRELLHERFAGRNGQPIYDYIIDTAVEACALFRELNTDEGADWFMQGFLAGMTAIAQMQDKQESVDQFELAFRMTVMYTQSKEVVEDIRDA